MQEFVSEDIYSFALSVERLVKVQKQEVELAIVGRGECKLRQKFQYLQVSPSDWSGMREDQRGAALKRIHTINMQEVLSCSVTSATDALHIGQHPVMRNILGTLRFDDETAFRTR